MPPTGRSGCCTTAAAKKHTTHISFFFNPAPSQERTHSSSDGLEATNDPVQMDPQRRDEASLLNFRVPGGARRGAGGTKTLAEAFLDGREDRVRSQSAFPAEVVRLHGPDHPTRQIQVQDQLHLFPPRRYRSRKSLQRASPLNHTKELTLRDMLSMSS